MLTSKLVEGGKNQNEEKITITKNQHKRRQERIKEDFLKKIMYLREG